MGDFTNLPIEVLAVILGYVNLNADLAQMRLVSSDLNALIWEEQHLYLRDTCSRYVISERVMDLYNNGHGVVQSSSELRFYLFFRREVAMFEALVVQLKEMDNTSEYLNQKESSITPFLLLSAFAGKFRSIVKRKAGRKWPFRLDLPENMLAVAESLHYYIGSSWELEEIEALISATNSCASALWSIDPSNRLRDFYVTSDTHRNQGCCIDVGYDGTQQALVTESVLRNGPRWAAGTLLNQRILVQDHWLPEDRSSHLRSSDALRRTPAGDCARLVAVGVVRMLWQLRASKIEEQQQRRESNKPETLKITDMLIISAVWRGSAGDM